MWAYHLVVLLLLCCGLIQMDALRQTPKQGAKATFRPFLSPFLLNIPPVVIPKIKPVQIKPVIIPPIKPVQGLKPLQLNIKPVLVPALNQATRKPLYIQIKIPGMKPGSKPGIVTIKLPNKKPGHVPGPMPVATKPPATKLPKPPLKPQASKPPPFRPPSKKPSNHPIFKPPPFNHPMFNPSSFNHPMFKPAPFNHPMFGLISSSPIFKPVLKPPLFKPPLNKPPVKPLVIKPPVFKPPVFKPLVIKPLVIKPPVIGGSNTNINGGTASVTRVDDVVISRSQTEWRCDKIMCPIKRTETCQSTKMTSETNHNKIERHNICFGQKGQIVASRRFLEQAASSNVYLSISVDRNGGTKTESRKTTLKDKKSRGDLPRGVKIKKGKSKGKRIKPKIKYSRYQRALNSGPVHNINETSSQIDESEIFSEPELSKNETSDLASHSSDLNAKLS